MKRSFLPDDAFYRGTLLDLPMQVLKNDPVGFFDRSESSLSWLDATRTLTITPIGISFRYQIIQSVYEKTSAESYQIPDVEGVHFIYYNGGVLSSTQIYSDSLFFDYVLVAAVYWDADNKKQLGVSDERHTIRFSPMLHQYLHEVLRTQWINGLALEDIVADGGGSLDIHAQLSITNGQIRDEDLLFSIQDDNPQNLSLPANLPVCYRTGSSGLWRKDVATNFPCKSFVGGSGRLAWNEYTGSVWTQTEVGLNQFVLSHIAVSNNIYEPIFVIQGQQSYGVIGDAQEGAEKEVFNLRINGFITSEFNIIGSVIFQTSQNYVNAIKAQIRSLNNGSTYKDWRKIKYVG